MKSWKLDKPFSDGPDFDHFRRVILREEKAGPVPFIEIAVDAEVVAAVLGAEHRANNAADLINKGPEPSAETIEVREKLFDLNLKFSRAVGYDYVSMVPYVPFPRPPVQLLSNPQQGDKTRGWFEEHQGLITNREEYNNFPWPHPHQVSVIPIDYAARAMPAGMKVMMVVGGIFEDLKLLMGFESMALSAMDEPDLVEDILERLTSLAVAATEQAAGHPACGAVFYAEDLGYKTQTILSPKLIRQWLIPRQKRIADAAHRHAKPFLIHSCGQIDAVMEDLIEVVGIDGRHSFEDAIEPVEQVYKKYGDRIAILGGVDVDLLSRGAPEQVRKRTREILSACGNGGFCLGSGNSVTNFCKLENYFAMLDEGRKWNAEKR